MNVKRLFKKHGSTMLTVAGAVGVVSTAVLTAKATPKALRLIEEVKEEKGEELTKMETIRAAWKPYIPAVVTGAATLSCIFGANVLNKKQQAALMSAYALLDQKYKEYKAKVGDICGEETEKEIRCEIAKNHYVPDDVDDDGMNLYYDEWSHRYYRAEPEVVKDAEYELNKMMAVLGSVCINDYYDLLGIDMIEGGNDVGWGMNCGAAWYGYTWVEFQQEKAVMDDGLEAIIVSPIFAPTADYMEY